MDELYTVVGRPLRVLFLGNDDNYNYRMATWSREMGVEADLWLIQPPDPYRGDIRLLEPDLDGRWPEWVKEIPLGDGRRFALRPGETGRHINHAYDFVGVAGPASLMASLRLRRPRGLNAIGAEVGDLPFPFKPEYATSIGQRPLRYNLSVALLIRAALRRQEFIVDSYEPHTSCLRRLGVLNKRVFRGLACDCEAERRRVRPQLRAELLARYGSARRVFLWFSRLNFQDPHALIYKGVERFLRALETMLPALQDGQVRVVVGKHGNEADAFLRLVETSPVKPFIDWVPHLGAAELVTYLSLPNAVLFAEFGEFQRELSGIGRDAAAMGTVTVSSALPEFVSRQFGAPGPLLHAVTDDQIAARMRELLAMPDDQFAGLQAEMRAFGETCVDYHALMPIFYGQVQQSLRRWGPAPG